MFGVVVMSGCTGSVIIIITVIIIVIIILQFLLYFFGSFDPDCSLGKFLLVAVSIQQIKITDTSLRLRRLTS